MDETNAVALTEEVNSLWVAFRKVNFDNTNLLTKDQLLEAVQNGLPMTHEEVDRLIDHDGKGEKVLTFVEFYEALTGNILDPRVSPAILAVFARYDYDSDGYLGKTDLFRAVDHGLKMTSDQIYQLLSTADIVNNERRISLSSFVNFFLFGNRTWS